MLKNEDVKRFYKRKDSDKIFWIERKETFYGEHFFTFDKKTFFNVFSDYPHKLTPEQKEIFDKENPYWVWYFSDSDEEIGDNSKDLFDENLEDYL